LNAAAASAGVSLTFVNALPDGSVEMQAGPVAPAAVFALFAQLDRDHGVRVRSADIARAAENPDLVRVQATLAP
jgi:type II secretory pathway component PulM